MYPYEKKLSAIDQSSSSRILVNKMIMLTDTWRIIQ